MSAPPPSASNPELTPQLNRLAKTVAKLNHGPQWWRRWLLDRALGFTIKLVGTAGVQCVRLTHEEGVFVLKSRRKVHNHIKGIHAAAMALLAETATGLVVGMNLPDDRLPLIKSLHVDYLKRASGDLKAVATLTPEQRALLLSEPKGEVTVAVRVTDSEGKEPIRCEMVWAWVPKRRP